jgi:hypothetical protein
VSWLGGASQQYRSRVLALRSQSQALPGQRGRRAHNLSLVPLHLLQFYLALAFRSPPTPSWICCGVPPLWVM